MQKVIKTIILLAAVMLPAVSFAQLSSNPDKFLGNITTDWPGSMDYNGFKYSDYWNQVTPENGTKWGTVQGSGKNSYYWTGADNAFNYAKNHNFPFKFHCLVWGSQYPNWVKNLSAEERYQAIVNWMDAAKKKYPNLEIIDVVNEAMNGHQNDTYLMSEALGGAGETGYDWLIKAFELAHERWPNAILIYNDYNVLQWGVEEFIGLVGTLRDAGAPIDAYGCQAHSFTLNDCPKSTLQNSLNRIQSALKMPMYITEYDINFSDDDKQETKFKEQIPLFWEADYCAGVTLWGWFVGHTWEENTGLIKGKTERKALKWLREYMQTDAAKNAKSPYPGMKKEASVYIKPSALHGKVGQPLDIEVRASMRSKTIDHIDLYCNDNLVETMTEAPYIVNYTPTDHGRNELKAVVTTTDGATYERYSVFNANPLLGVDERFTSLTEIGSTPFAIVNENEGKAFYGSYDQNLGYADFKTAFDKDNSGYLFKLKKTSGGFRLRLITPDGSEYQVFGDTGYLNSQTTDGNCCFILGLNGQNGQDLPNGAVWSMEYVEGKGFSMKNVGTGKYLKTNDTAKYDEPTYFTFCTLKEVTTGMEEIIPTRTNDVKSGWYTLSGRKLTGMPTAKGIYIMNGKKVVIK